MTIFFMDGELLKRIMAHNRRFMKEIFNMEKNMVKGNMNTGLTIFTMEIGHLIKKMVKEFINILRDFIMVSGKQIKNMDKEL